MTGEKEGLGAKVRFVVDLAAKGNVTPAGALKALRERYPGNKISYLRTVVYGHAKEAGARFVETARGARRGDGRPAAGTCAGRVWDLADQITREQGRLATRTEVRDRYASEGGRANTANTAYQAWKQAQATAGRNAPAPPRDVIPRQLAVAADGRCVIPREMRDAMRLQSGDPVIARVEDGELRLVAPAVAVEQVQARMRKYGQEGVVDRFLAERRALWDGA